MTKSEHLSTCNFVIFGGNGDLAIRKLLPAIYHLIKDGHLSSEIRVIGASRSALSNEQYQENVLKGLKEFVPDYDDEIWQQLKPRLQYVSVDASNEESFENLKMGRNLLF